MDPEDINLLKTTGGTVSHCPTSNMYLGSGIAPIPEMLKAGIPGSLDTDGAASNNTNNGWELLKLTALLHKVVHRDATVINANQVLQMGTLMGAKAMGLSSQIGSIEIGKQADLVVINAPNYKHIPYKFGSSSLIDMVIKNGKVVASNTPTLVKTKI